MTAPGWTEEPVAVGLVGAGPWAHAMHAPMLAAGPETRLAAVWARRESAGAELARRFNVPAASSFDHLLDSCEAVDFAVPPDVQARLVPAASAAGKALLLEKPLGLNLGEGRAVADAVRAAQVPNIVVLTKRFHPATRRFLNQAAALCERGPVEGVVATYLDGGLLDGPFATPWRLAHGALMDLGPHLLDLVEAAAGPLRSVQATGDPLRYLAVATEHEGGVGQLALSGTVDVDRSVTRLELFSSHGMARWDNSAVDHDDCWPVLRSEFAGAVRHGTPVTVDVTRGLRLQVCLDAIVRSLMSSTRVTVSPEGS